MSNEPDKPVQLISQIVGALTVTFALTGWAFVQYVPKLHEWWHHWSNQFGLFPPGQ